MTAEVESFFSRLNSYEIDFSDVRGQEFAKRALVVAASGAHNVLMLWSILYPALAVSTGRGKSMLAARLPTILPPLTEAESLETTGIYSATGRLGADEALVTRRPFRTPHHTIATFLHNWYFLPQPGSPSVRPLGPPSGGALAGARARASD